MKYDRLPLGRLRLLAVQSHPEHTDEAARVYVQRMIDLELERRMDLVHRRPGWHPHSPGFGDGTGATTKAIDAMFLAYEKGIPNSEWHERARVMLAKLPARKLMALMIKTAKMDQRLEGPWCATFDQIAASISLYSRMLGWGATGPAGHTFDCIEERNGVRVRTQHRMKAFKDGKAIKNAANEARVELMLIAKSGAS